MSTAPHPGGCGAVDLCMTAAPVVVRWRHAPALIPLGLLAAAAGLWVLYAFVQRRRVRVSDATASAIDDEAGLAGELRSAAWFASRDVADSWTGLHLSRAADRLESLDLSHLYPAVRARRARVATFVMAAIAVLLVTPLPGRPQAVAPPPNAQSAPPPRAVQPIALEGVPAELPQELEALLTAIENGTFAARQPEADVEKLVGLVLQSSVQACDYKSMRPVGGPFFECHLGLIDSGTAVFPRSVANAA